MGKLINMVDLLIADDVFEFIKNRSSFFINTRQEDIINKVIGNYINNNEDLYVEEIQAKISLALKEEHIVFIDIQLEEFMKLFLLALKELYNYDTDNLHNN